MVFGRFLECFKVVWWLGKIVFLEGFVGGFLVVFKVFCVKCFKVV